MYLPMGLSQRNIGQPMDNIKYPTGLLYMTTGVPMASILCPKGIHVFSHGSIICEMCLAHGRIQGPMGF